MTEPAPTTAAAMYDQVTALFPCDGPHFDARTVGAAECLAHLVRYLNHATRHRESMAQPATLAALINGLKRTIGGMRQALDQVDDRNDMLARQPGAYTDHPGSDVDPVATARTIGEHLSDAHAGLRDVLRSLESAHNEASRQGIQPPRPRNGKTPNHA